VSGSIPRTQMSFSHISPEPPPRRSWMGAGGLPSAYVVRAALHAAALIDAAGSMVGQARESYWHKATGGEFSAANLRVGEDLLLDTGLLIERGGRLHLTTGLEELLEGSIDDATVALALEAGSLPGMAGPVDPGPELEALVPDAERREELLIARAQRFDDRRRRLIGEIGEEVVLAAARQELNSMNREDLARSVRRVSLDSDALGYDINAPRLVGQPRLLEVKATTNDGQPIRIHLSRNEARVGAAYPNWSLVVCAVLDLAHRNGEIRGWCHAAILQGRLPIDTEGGRWDSAELEIRPAELSPGLPPATL
jgi:Domain of unknown function (DUF3883)